MQNKSKVLGHISLVNCFGLPAWSSLVVWLTSLLSVPTDSRVGKEEGLGYEEVVVPDKLH